MKTLNNNRYKTRVESPLLSINYEYLTENIKVLDITKESFDKD